MGIRTPTTPEANTPPANISPTTPSTSPWTKRGAIATTLALGAGLAIHSATKYADEHPDSNVADLMAATADTVRSIVATPKKPETVSVRWSTLAFRTEPNFKKETKTGYFRQGTQLELLEKRGFWLKIKDPKNENSTLWVWGGYLKNEAQAKIGRSIEFQRDARDAKDVAGKPTNAKEIMPARDPHFDFAPQEEARLERYSAMRENLDITDHDDLNRTFEHRHKDHELLLGALLKDGKTTPEIAIFKSLLLPRTDSTPLFIDIGPGIANTDKVRTGGKGKPAPTLQEIAELFPEMQTIGLDLPSEMDAFMGKNPKHKVDEANKQALLAHQNIHLMSGNGLSSLKRMMARTDNNPLPDRERPQITPATTMIIRSANALELFNKWSDGVKQAFIKLAEDLPQQPILYLYNREIIFKPAGSHTWTIIGMTSNRGFRHFSRDLTRDGQPPYRLDKAKLERLRPSPMAENNATIEAKSDNDQSGGMQHGHLAPLQ